MRCEDKVGHRMQDAGWCQVSGVAARMAGFPQARKLRRAANAFEPRRSAVGRTERETSQRWPREICSKNNRKLQIQNSKRASPRRNLEIDGVELKKCQVWRFELLIGTVDSPVRALGNRYETDRDKSAKCQNRALGLGWLTAHTCRYTTFMWMTVSRPVKRRSEAKARCSGVPIGGHCFQRDVADWQQ